MTLLITGIHGFVGSNLVAALKDKHTIYGLDIISPEKEGVKQTFSWNDIDKLPEVDAIIHLAGKAHDTKNKSEAQVYFDINTGLTQKIFDWFTYSNAKTFIFFSSIKAAADKVEGDMVREDVIPNPVGPYGESKIKAEEYIQKVTSYELQVTDKQVYILRPCMIHGPGNKGNLNLLYSVVSKGIPWPLAAFENKRSFLSIQNLSFVIARMLDVQPESGIYHIADDEPLSTNELIELIAASKGKKASLWKINKSFIQSCAQIGNILHLPLNTDRLQKLTENYVVCNEKIKKALDLDDFPVDVRTGISSTLETFD